MATTLELWNKVSTFPKGKWTFSRMLCLKAPYFGSISPLFIELKPNYCEIAIKKTFCSQSYWNSSCDCDV